MAEKKTPRAARKTAAATAIIDKRISINATPAEAFEFASKLAHDDEFRSRVECNPEEALAEYHIYLQDLPEEITLPPKEDLQVALKQLTLGQEFQGGVVALSPFLAFFAFFIFAKK